MPKTVVVIGPAGTGKTTAALTVIKDSIGRGVSPDEIAYLTFTRAAADEGLSRILTDEVGFGLDEKDFPYFRTLHSLAFRGLRGARDVKVIKPVHMREFARETGFDGTFVVKGWEDLAEAYQKLEGGGRSEWDQCLDGYAFSRITARTPEEFMLASRRMSNGALVKMGGFMDSRAYEAFILKYEKFKEDKGLVDFTDMLAYAYLEMEPLDKVKQVIIDEVQDCAPVLYGIVDRVFRNAETVWLVGDVNQTIYSFSGADPKILLDRIKRAHATMVLRQTHRFGQGIVDFSAKIIERAEDKYVVDLIGAPGKGHKIDFTGQFEPRIEPSFILHRHVMGCAAAGKRFMDAGLPFRNERGRDPLGYVNRIRAFNSINDLADGKTVPLGAVSRIVDLLPSSLKPEAGKKGVRLVVHGTKKKLEEGGSFPAELSIETLVSSKIMTEEGAEIIRRKDYSAFEHSEDLQYYKRVIDNGHPLDGDRIPVITTIHGSKGRQAKRVVIFSETGRRCWEDPGTEHRLAYVASTRAEREIEICVERTLDWAQAPYDYPEPDVREAPDAKSVPDEEAVDSW